MRAVDGKEYKMANVISDETMEYVAILAKLELSPEEKEQETAEFFRNVAAEFDSEINFT